MSRISLRNDRIPGIALAALLVLASACSDDDPARPDPDDGPDRPAAVETLELWSSDMGSLTVVWPAAADDPLHTPTAGYEIRTSTAPIDAVNWNEATPADTQPEAHFFDGMLRATVRNLVPQTSYHVAIRAVDEPGRLSDFGAQLNAETIVKHTWYVNVEGTGSQPTIGAAVLASGPGDLILVAPGRYTWTNQGTGHPQYGLVYVPRGYTHFEIRSLAGPETTILDAEQNANVLFITGGVNLNDEGVQIKDAITVDGFTLTGGRALGQANVPGEAYAGGGLVFHLTDAVIRNCIITGNEATQGGGVWYGGVGHPMLENCVISNNRSPAGGGVLLVNSSDRITLRGCTIRDNVSTNAGGGLSVYNALFTLDNCFITGNRAASRGGGLNLSTLNDGCEVTACTIAANVAGSGAGLYMNNNSVISLRRSILAFNSGPWITDTLGSGASASCCDIYGNGDDEARPEIWDDEGGLFSEDPLFAAPGDYTLQSGSPCLPGAHPDGTDCGRIGAGGL